MKISEWLDKKEAESIDVSQITLPDGLSYKEQLVGRLRAAGHEQVEKYL